MQQHNLAVSQKQKSRKILHTAETLTTTQTHKKTITRENNYTDVESSTSQNGDANHQKIQADFEAGGADRKNILVPQKRGITKKMGKKCFCGTADFLWYKKQPPKNSCPHGNSAPKSHLKTTPKMSRSRSWKFPQQADVCSEISLYLQWIQTNRI